MAPALGGTLRLGHTIKLTLVGQHPARTTTFIVAAGPAVQSVSATKWTEERLAKPCHARCMHGTSSVVSTTPHCRLSYNPIVLLAYMLAAFTAMVALHIAPTKQVDELGTNLLRAPQGPVQGMWLPRAADLPVKGEAALSTYNECCPLAGGHASPRRYCLTVMLGRLAQPEGDSMSRKQQTMPHFQMQPAGPSGCFGRRGQRTAPGPLSQAVRLWQ